MTLKEKVYTSCLSTVQEKINFLRSSLSDLSDGAKNDTKSSAGDKYETARAMIQLEQEKIGTQLMEYKSLLAILNKIDIQAKLNKVVIGNLVKTNVGYFFVSVALGKIYIDGMEVFALSPQSPLGKRLLGMEVKQSVELNDKTYIVEEIY
jgi:transcription elongation GreA/GreB family factor